MPRPARPPAVTRRLLAALAAACLPVCGPAFADPGYYLLTPYSQAGDAALDLRFWSVKAPAEPATLWPEIGVRYGVDSRWTSELLASFIGDSLRKQKLSSINWQNTWLLTQGQYPVDVALHAQLIHNHGEGNALEAGPLLQGEWGLTQLNLNLVFAHDWPSDRGTQLKYQWGALRRVHAGLRLGLQGFGEPGRWDHGSEHPSHRAGPVLRVGLPGHIEMQAVYLWGKTYGSRGDMFSTQLLWPF